MALKLTHTPFSVSSVLGLVALLGVSVETAVILVSYINKLRLEGMDIPTATREASLLRLRPIMMTALVACLGLLPAALSTGIGSATQKPFAIRVAPDNKLIAVVMKINLKEDLTKTAVAQLKVAGITGLVFVELEGKKPKEPDQSPKLNFPAEYPVIASRPSDIQRIMSGVNVVMEKFTQMDTQGIFDQFKSTAAEVEIFFKGKRMRTIMTNVEGTTGNARDITGQINKMLAAGRVNDVLLEGKTALKEVQTAVVALREEMHDMNLPETVSRARAIAAEVGTTTENLRRTTENLEDFMRRINDRPSDLLFGKPPKGRWNEAPKP